MMEISFSEARAGDVLVFRRNPKDPVSGVLTWLLRRLEPEFDMWIKGNNFSPWHIAPVTRIGIGGCWVMDARADGAEEIFYPVWYTKEQCKVYRWLKKKPTQKQIAELVEIATGLPYDIKAYPVTVISYFIKKIFKYSFRLHDKMFHCLELTDFFMRELGRELWSIDEYPLVSSGVKRLGV